MNEAPEPYFELVESLTARFRGLDAHGRPDQDAPFTQDVATVPLDAERACLRRVKSSHQGISRRRRLRDLVAIAVDQAYLDEICVIDGLERLELSYPVTAHDLSGLRALTGLRHLAIDSPRNVTDFRPLLDIPSLRTLLIGNARHMKDIAWLADAHHLEVIGIEGSTWTQQKVPSLSPLRGLEGMKAFFATSVRIGDNDLSPLAACPQLEFLECARCVPRSEFERLQRLRPDLICYWFRWHMWDRHGW